MKHILLILSFGIFISLFGNGENNYTKKINIVIDNNKNIMWQDDNEATEYLETITMANVYCENLILNGYIDWKLPNIKELQSIIDVTNKNSSINKKFKYLKNDKYWSKTDTRKDNSRYWYVDFETGLVGQDKYSKTYYVRCLRNIK